MTCRADPDADHQAAPYGQIVMKGTWAVLWTLHGKVHAGCIEALADRLELRTRGRAVAIPLQSISQFTIERGATVRINGLPVLTLRLADGDIVRLASLEGTGVLHELAALLAPPVQPLRESLRLLES
jgi:hypothetical protein